MSRALRLSKHSQDQSTIAHYFKIIGQHPLLTAEQEREYTLKMQAGDQHAKNRLIESNLRLVVKIASFYKTRGSLTFLDLISEGNFGLIRGIEGFNPNMGCRLSTYVTWWIRERINRAILSRDRMIRIPVHKLQLYHRFYSIRQKIFSETYCEPTTAELAQHLNLSEEEVTELESLCQDTHYLEDLSDAGYEHMVTCEDDATKDPLAESVHQSDNKKQVAEYLQYLNERQQRVVMMIYGLNSYHEHTLTQCALELKISRERVRQIHLEAIKKIQKVICEHQTGVAA